MSERLAIDGGSAVRPKGFPQRIPYGEDDLNELREAIESQDLFCFPGRKVPALEHAFASKYNVPHALACSPGTAAVHTAIAALDPEPGDEIITAPVTDLAASPACCFRARSRSSRIRSRGHSTSIRRTSSGASRRARAPFSSFTSPAILAT